MLFFAHFWCRFWCRFGSHLAPILGLLGAQVGPSWVQNCSCHAIFIQNVIFQKNKENQWFFKVFASPDGTKNAPRSLQDGPKEVFKGYFFDVKKYNRFCSVLGSILAPSWHPFWSSKRVPKSTKLRVWSQGVPKRAQEASKRLPRGPQEAPRSPQEAPKRTQDGPTRAQEGPKRAQEASQEGAGERMSYYLPVITY